MTYGNSTHRRTLVPALLMATVLAATSATANAALTSYTANGASLVRFQRGGVDITLTANGNLLASLLQAHSSNTAGFINDVIAASVYNGTPGTLFDTYHRTWTLSASDFSSDGSVTWFGAKALINYLNQSNYAGTNQWRLPTIQDSGAPGCDYAFSGTDCGFNVDVGTSELARLYYDELGRRPGFDTAGVAQSGYGIFANDGQQTPNGVVGPFNQVSSVAYWSGNEYGPLPGAAWAFGTVDGVQAFESKQSQFYAWAVTPGQVTPVPVPAALWLLAPALVGLAGRRRAQMPKPGAAIG